MTSGRYKLKKSLRRYSSTNFDFQLINTLTSQEWARTTKAKVRDDWTSEDPEHYGAEYENTEDDGTTHISIVDQNGDAVAVTSTINTLWGSSMTTFFIGFQFIQISSN